MGKIYRRETLKTSTTPKKKDEKRRKRNVIMNFRVSPEEKERIEEHLSRIERTDELDPVVMEQLLMILELYQGLEK